MGAGDVDEANGCEIFPPCLLLKLGMTKVCALHAASVVAAVEMIGVDLCFFSSADLGGVYTFVCIWIIRLYITIPRLYHVTDLTRSIFGEATGASGGGEGLVFCVGIFDSLCMPGTSRCYFVMILPYMPAFSPLNFSPLTLPTCCCFSSILAFLVGFVAGNGGCQGVSRYVSRRQIMCS